MRSKINRLVFGILAHVDAGKTTLSESILYKCGITNEQGRVDHGDAFLDNSQFERGRGITVYSKEVAFNYQDVDFTLIDTPGHKDFIGELERVLPVLDCAILVISGSEPVTARSTTLFNLLMKHKIPTVIFVNKVDVPYFDKDDFTRQIKEKVCSNISEFDPDNLNYEEMALCDESALTEYLETEQLSTETIRNLYTSRKVIPTIYGSALNNKGTMELLKLLSDFIEAPTYSDDFSALVYKISRDDKGNKLSHMKITGGTLQVKDSINDEKVNEILTSTGKNEQKVSQVSKGQCCKVIGLGSTYSGQVLGNGKAVNNQVTNANIKYEIVETSHVAYNKFVKAITEINEEFPEVTFEKLEDNRIFVGLTGALFGETLKEIFKRRYDMTVEFLEPRVSYFEVFKGEAEEPVYLGLPNSLPQISLEMKEVKAGEHSGSLSKDRKIEVISKCREDQLNQERQEILVETLNHRLLFGDINGINGGFPLTNISFTFSSGRGSLKQVDDGKIQEAAKMAIYRALLQGETHIVEPYIEYQVSCYDKFAGKVSVIISKLSGTLDDSSTNSDMTTYRGYLPLILSQELSKQVESATLGSCEAEFGQIDYRKCHNQEEVARKNGGNKDLVIEYFEEIWQKPEEAFMETSAKGGNVPGAEVTNKELSQIFNRSYASNKSSKVKKESRIIRGENSKDANYKGGNTGLNAKGKNTLIIDGYNIIFAWEELKEVSKSDLGAARESLIEIMSNYAGFTGQDTVIVFDAYKQAGNQEKVENIAGIKVVYTAYGDTADSYIEKTVYEERDKGLITVATSDRLEQMNVFSQGALRMSARELQERVKHIEEKISEQVLK